MYVVKDLVPDMNHFYDQYRSIQPWLQRNDEDKLGDGTSQLLQSTEDRAKLVRTSSSSLGSLVLFGPVCLLGLHLSLGRPVRVHPVCVLLFLLPFLLVERRQVSGASCAHAGLQVRI